MRFYQNKIRININSLSKTDNSFYKRKINRDVYQEN